MQEKVEDLMLKLMVAKSSFMIPLKEEDERVLSVCKPEDRVHFENLLKERETQIFAQFENALKWGWS